MICTVTQMLLYLYIDIMFMHPALSAYLCFPHLVVIGATSTETHTAIVISTQHTQFHFVQSDPFCMVQC